jgi:hypothetical protein
MRGCGFAARARRTAALVSMGAAALGGCIPTGDSLPDGAATLPCLGPSCIPPDGGAPVTSAPLVDCTSAELPFQFSPFMILDNEQSASAQFFYDYEDGTSGVTPSGYSPPALAQNRCLTDTSNHVFHISGGPFLGWGGGIGIALQHLNQDESLCTGATPPDYCPPLGMGAAGQAINFAALDVSQWDGIAFWARRGPNSQPLLRVLVGDKYTDDDISYLMYLGNPKEPRFCERDRECDCTYLSASCSFYSADPSIDPTYAAIVTNDVDGGGYYCGNPGSVAGTTSSQTGVVISVNGSSASNKCNVTSCDAVYPAYPNNGPDPAFVGKTCAPYTYRNGSEVDLCYNPGTDPAPAEPDEQCGDHFSFPVNLSTDWQLYTVPFSVMSQQGWAKQAPTFDLTSVSVVRFTWDVGYIDYYLDDVRFYKAASGGSAAPP